MSIVQTTWVQGELLWRRVSCTHAGFHGKFSLSHRHPS